MRVTVAVGAAVSVIVVGVFAISESATQVQDATNSTAANTSYDVAEGVFGGAIQAGGPGIVWFGVAAIVLVALGFLVAAGRGGRR